MPQTADIPAPRQTAQYQGLFLEPDIEPAEDDEEETGDDRVPIITA